MTDDAIYRDNSELAQLISVAAKQLVDRARSLGLTWTLRIATIANSVEDSLTAIFDGDTVSIPVTNISGFALTPGQRVYCLIIPPSGNFVIGFTGFAIDPPISTQGVASPLGTLASSSGGEVAIPSGSWAAEPVARLSANQIARVVIVCGNLINTATDSVYIVRLRDGSATISGTMLCAWRVGASSAVTTVQSSTLVGYIKNTSGSTATSVLSLSIMSSAGASTASLYADTTLPTIVTIEPIGPVADNVALASACVSI